jgi:hypothetical protein
MTASTSGGKHEKELEQDITRDFIDTGLDGSDQSYNARKSDFEDHLRSNENELPRWSNDILVEARILVESIPIQWNASSDFLERTKEVTVDVVIVDKADQVVALLDLNENSKECRQSEFQRDEWHASICLFSLNTI